MSDTSRLAAIAFSVLCTSAGQALAVPAFSGAEGWGAITPGGRGGSVIHVTNLNDSGPGSFRAACEASGPRTIVFDVSGQINLLSEVSITNPYLTIAGQTAPGEGVIIAGETVSLDATDIIMRYVRLRRGNTTRADDALGSDRTGGNIIIDHVSTSWGLDENLSIYRWKNLSTGKVTPTHNVTIQWCVSSEALNPNNHAFGATWGGKGVNFHHNLFACNTGRNPSISFSHFFDFRNNVLFNWQHRSVDGAGPEAHVNMINNYYKPGPATNSGQLQYRIVKPEVRQNPPVAGPGVAGWWYVDGNYVVGNATVTTNNWNGGVQWDPGIIGTMLPEYARVLTPHTDVSFAPDPLDPYDAPIPTLPTIATQSAQDAYQLVLAGAGANLPVRDAVDARVMNMVATGIATFGPNGNGIINHPNDVGGYPVIPFVTRPGDWDTDQDGMPDAWETAYGLNPNNAADRNNDLDTDGYTNLEEYLNELGAFAAPQPVVWDGGNARYALIDNWDIAFQPSRFDTAKINSGTATVDAIGQHAGNLRVGHDAGSNGALTVTGGWLKVANSMYVGSASGSAGTLTLSGGVLKVAAVLHVHKTGTIQFSGGAVDIEAGAAVVDPPSPGIDLLAGLTQQVQNGRNGGTGDGPGVRSSIAAASSGRYAVGIARNGDLGGPFTIFAGQGVTLDSILLRLTWLGDTNLDGQVDITDLGNLASSWQTAGSWINGDSDYSGFIDITDLGMLATNWQAGVGPGAPGLGLRLDEALASLGLPALSVPEPSAIGLTGLCLACVALRRRGHRRLRKSNVV